MPVLFKLHLSKHRKGFGVTVKAVPTPGLVGMWDAKDKCTVIPDLASVRDCLPANWHKAFDRAMVWYDPDGRLCEDGHQVGRAPYLTLKDVRGRYINTIYFIPYRYTPA